MVGYAQTLAGDGSVGAHAAAWTSPDGVTWTRATDTTAMDVGPCVDTGEAPYCGGMRAVAATAGGGFVAVGQALNGNAGQGRPAAWTSPDGLTWTLASNGLDFDGRLSAVATGGTGLVAVGMICKPDCLDGRDGGVVATSIDGSTWTTAAVEGAPALSAVASAGEQYFAIGGTEADGSGPPQLQLWRSVDGLAWQRESSMPLIPDAIQFLGADIAASPDRVVVVVSGRWGGVDDSFQNVAFSSPPASSPAEPAP